MDNADYQESWYNSFYGYNNTQSKCECGCTKTFGKDCNVEFHSNWCPVSPNYKNKQEANNISMFGEYHD